MISKRDSPSGVILVDKPEGITSHDVVVRLRRALGMRKVGHAGTLDPFATGLLVMMTGEGTKLSDYLMAGKKVYTARIKLGDKTDTGDLSGNVLERLPFDTVTEEDIKRALAGFTGTVYQIPPMYSAIKKDGIPLYRFARKGLGVEREKRKVFISGIELMCFVPPFIDIKVCCSKGTYIRTLAEDISATLGTCGHLSALRRIKCGSFGVEGAISAADINDKGEVLNSIIPIAEALSFMPGVIVKGHAVEKIMHGSTLRAGWIGDLEADGVSKGEKVKVMAPDGHLVSIMELLKDIGGVAVLSDEEVIGRSLRVFNV